MFPKAGPTVWFPLAIAICVHLFFGYLHSTAAQPLPSAPNITRSPNPRVNIKYITVVRREDRSKDASASSPKLSAAEERRQAIEQAIEDGNKARDNSEYEKAFASYRKVSEELDRKDSRAIYGLGNIYADLACTDNAIRAYNEALSLKKDYRDARIALANAYVSKARFDEAAGQFKSLFSADSNDVAGRLGLALIAGKRKQYDLAIRDLNIISENSSIDDKDRANAHLILGDIFMEQKKYAEAAVEFKKVIELKYFLPGAYIKLGLTELYPAMSRYSSLVTQELTIADREAIIKAARFAAENIRKAIYEYNYTHPFGHLWLANALMNQMSYQDAESNLEIYIRKVKELQNSLPLLATNCDYGFNELYAFGYLGLALVYNHQSLRETDEKKRTELHKRVTENAKQLLRVRENDVRAYSLLAQIYFQNGKYDEAIEELRKAITHETNAENKAGLYGLLGLAYSRLDRDTEAIAALEDGIRLQPESASDRFSLAGIYEKQGNLDEAIRLKKEGIALMQQPTAATYCMVATAYLSRARQKDDSKDYEEAIDWLRKALGINPNFGSAYFLLGQVYKFYKGGDHADKALENFEMAAKYNPNDASIYLQIGDLYYSVKKNNDAAIKYLKDAIRLNPNLAIAYWELGAAYRDTGNDVEAIKYFLEAIRSNSNYQDAYFSLITIYRSQKNYGEAIKLLSRMFEIAPKEFWPYKELAKIYEAQQKNDDAIKYYQQAIALLKPDDTFGKELYLVELCG